MKLSQRYFIFILIVTFVDLGFSSEKYINNDNGTVIDQSTGLIWQIIGSHYTTWKEAMAYCDNLILAEKTDWRLPSLQELQSLVDYEKCDPAINSVYFPDTESSNYWTNTKYVDTDHFSWYVNFYNGHVSAFDKSSYYCVRCVRGNSQRNKKE